MMASSAALAVSFSVLASTMAAKPQLSKFENCLNYLVVKFEEDYRALISDIIKIKPEIQQDEYMLHWITHMSIDAFIHLLTLEPDEKKAMEHMKLIMKYIVSGWMQLVIRPSNE